MNFTILQFLQSTIKTFNFYLKHRVKTGTLWTKIVFCPYNVSTKWILIFKNQMIFFISSLLASFENFEVFISLESHSSKHDSNLLERSSVCLFKARHLFCVLLFLVSNLHLKKLVSAWPLRFFNFKPPIWKVTVFGGNGGIRWREAEGKNGTIVIA